MRLKERLLHRKKQKKGNEELENWLAGGLKPRVDAGFIKLADENASLKNRRYIPYWA